MARFHEVRSEAQLVLRRVDVVAHGRPPQHHGLVHQAAAGRGIDRPGLPEPVELVGIGSGSRDRRAGARVGVHEARPREAELAVLHGHATRLFEQAIALVHMDDDRVDAAHHRVHAVQVAQLLSGALALGDLFFETRGMQFETGVGGAQLFGLAAELVRHQAHVAYTVAAA